MNFIHSWWSDEVRLTQALSERRLWQYSDRDQSSSIPRLPTSSWKPNIPSETTYKLCRQLSLGVPLLRNNTDWGCRRKKRYGKYVELKEEAIWEWRKLFTKYFRICTLTLLLTGLLSRWLNQNEWDGLNM